MFVESSYSQSNKQVTPVTHHLWWHIIAVSLFVLAALVIAYQPVMFNFFTSDDFYIISWLHSVKNSPLLLFQGIYEGTPYYRPLTNLFWFAEYLLCGTNSWLFRVIAMGCEFVTAIVMGFILLELLPDKIEQGKISTCLTWSIFSAGLFLLYPLHTEPINWFVSTTEVLVNFFVLSSFLFYLRWRRQPKSLHALISCAFAICAFLSKETAVILPPILATYELLLSKNPRLFVRCLYTAPYWFLLGAYLLVRKYMTGSFIGSWSTSVFHFTSNQQMFKAWLQSLKMILVPLSSAVFNHNLSYYLWLFMVIALIALTIRSLWKNPNRAALGIFIILWFFVSLLPMLKLLWITPDLLNARYGYIASVPLCAFLMFGLATSGTHKWANYGRYVLFFLVLTFSAMVLRTNNLAWAQAGQLTNNMRNDFAQIHGEIAGDPVIYFFNIPVQYKGVPIAGIKTIQSMNHIPFSDKNYDNGLWLFNSDPLGLRKTGTYFYRWNMRDQHFYQISSH